MAAAVDGPTPGSASSSSADAELIFTSPEPDALESSADPVAPEESADPGATEASPTRGTLTFCPSATLAAWLSEDVSASAAKPPAAAMASATREPSARVTTPGCITAPPTSTMTWVGASSPASSSEAASPSTEPCTSSLPATASEGGARFNSTPPCAIPKPNPPTITASTSTSTAEPTAHGLALNQVNSLLIAPARPWTCIFRTSCNHARKARVHRGHEFQKVERNMRRCVPTIYFSQVKAPVVAPHGKEQGPIRSHSRRRCERMGAMQGRS